MYAEIDKGKAPNYQGIFGTMLQETDNMLEILDKQQRIFMQAYTSV